MALIRKVKNMKNQITFVVEENDDINKLRSMNYDIETRMAVVDRLFTNHKDDADSSVFDSVPYKQYSKELQEAYVSYDIEKENYGQSVLRPIVEEKTGKKDISFDWNLDFQTLEVTVTL